MSTTIVIDKGIITVVNTDFECPKCNCPHYENSWYPKYSESKNGLIYIKCKGCKTKLGITTDLKGDVVVWIKEEETKG